MESIIIDPGATCLFIRRTSFFFDPPTEGHKASEDKLNDGKVVGEVVFAHQHLVVRDQLVHL